MSDYPTGGGFNYDFWNQYLDLDDEDTTTTDTTTTGTATDTNAVLQFIDDLFEDPTFIENLNQLTETQNWNPEEQSFEDWANDDWDNYWSQLLSGDEGSGFDYDFWSDWLDLDDDEDTTTTDTTTTDTTTEGETVDINENPLPPTADVKIGERHEVIDENGRTVIYECSLGTDGKTKIWTKVEGGAGDDKGGLFGLGVGPWLKDLFGLSDTGVGDFLSGIFGSSGGIKSLMELMAAYAKMKGAYDQYRHRVPQSQSDAMSGYEKANPLDIDMGLEGLDPKYLKDQLYGIPIGAKNVPAATHTLGLPYAEEIPVETEEEVQGAQRGGIMNARSHGDIVPALLEPGEFVMNLQSVKGAGNGDARQGAKRMYKMMRQLERMGQ